MSQSNKLPQLSIFGGTGFVGSEFIRRHGQNAIVVPRDERTPPTENLLYLISTTHNYHVFEDVHHDVQTNLVVLLDVLRNLRPGSTVNFVSSWFVYGDATLPATEESPCNPKGFYSITKRAAEQLLISYCQTFHHHYRILRLCNVYGVGDAGASKKKNALQFLINEMKANRDIQLYHDGNFYRDYMHVRDVADAIAVCVEKAPLDTIINVGSNEKIVFRELILQAKEMLNSKSRLLTMEPPEFHKVVQVKDFYMDSSRLFSLGFKPNVLLTEGLKELCQ